MTRVYILISRNMKTMAVNTHSTAMRRGPWSSAAMSINGSSSGVLAKYSELPRLGSNEKSQVLKVCIACFEVEMQEQDDHQSLSGRLPSILLKEDKNRTQLQRPSG